MSGQGGGARRTGVYTGVNEDSSTTPTRPWQKKTVFRGALEGLKGLKSQNLRDHMSEAELIFTALAELSTRQIAETDDARGMEENTTAAKTGGNIAKKARKDLEKKTGKKVVTGENFLPPSVKKKLSGKKTKKRK